MPAALRSRWNLSRTTQARPYVRESCLPADSVGHSRWPRQAATAAHKTRPTIRNGRASSREYGTEKGEGSILSLGQPPTCSRAVQRSRTAQRASGRVEPRRLLEEERAWIGQISALAVKLR